MWVAGRWLSLGNQNPHALGQVSVSAAVFSEAFKLQSLDQLDLQNLAISVSASHLFSLCNAGDEGIPLI